MTILRLAQHLSTVNYCADADHPIARLAGTDSPISSADLLKFIAEVDTIIDVTLRLRCSTPEESPTVLRAVDSTFFEVDASTAIIDKLARTYPEAIWCR
jgi:hypothetical protein